MEKILFSLSRIVSCGRVDFLLWDFILWAFYSINDTSNLEWNEMFVYFFKLINN